VYRPFRFQKCCQDFICTHNETFSVSMRVHNPDRSPFAIQRRDVAVAPSGFVEIVSDDFPLLHRDASCLFCTQFGNAIFPHCVDISGLS
jgi:hypothetical protein